MRFCACRGRCHVPTRWTLKEASNCAYKLLARSRFLSAYESQIEFDIARTLARTRALSLVLGSCLVKPGQLSQNSPLKALRVHALLPVWNNTGYGVSWTCWNRDRTKLIQRHSSRVIANNQPFSNLIRQSYAYIRLLLLLISIYVSMTSFIFTRIFHLFRIKILSRLPFDSSSTPHKLQNRKGLENTDLKKLNSRIVRHNLCSR